MNPSRPDQSRVVIVGGGAAALEAMLALRAFCGERVSIDMYAPREDFVMRPLAVVEAFGEGEVLKFDLDDVVSQSGGKFHRHSVVSVNPSNRRIILQDGTEVAYDYVIVATGTKSLWVVPGATTFWGPGSQESVTEVLDLMKTRENPRVVLTMPDRTGWPLPIYEFAIYLASMVKRDDSLSAEIMIVSPESSPLQAFGSRATDSVAEMLEENGIGFLADTAPAAFRGGRLSTLPDESLEADAVLTLPHLTGRHVDGIPFNDDGFIPTDSHGRIEGLEREYAAGDVIDYPLKFGGFATGQADVVARSIAADIRGDSPPDEFEPEFKATILTPDGPVFLGEGEDWSDLDQEAASEGWNPARKIRGKYLSPVLTRLVGNE